MGIDPSPETRSDRVWRNELAWERRAYKGCKVFVEVGEDGALVLQENGLASFRYRTEDSRTYSARPERILPLDEGGGVSAPSPPESAPPETGVIQVWAKGVSDGDPGPAGIGVVFSYRGVCKELSEFVGHRSEEFAELLAIKSALETLRPRDPRQPIVLATASSRCHEVLARGERVTENEEIFRLVRGLARKFPRLDFRLVGGQEEFSRFERAANLARQAQSRRTSESRVTREPS